MDPPTFGTAVTLPIAGDSTRRGSGASFSSDKWVRHESIVVHVFAQDSRAVTVVISGNRATDRIAADELRCAGIDGRLSDLDSRIPSHLMPLISDNWEEHFEWRGDGTMPDAERAKLREMVRKAHSHGRMVRF